MKGILCSNEQKKRCLGSPGPVPYLLFLARGFGTSCEEVEVGKDRNPAVDRGASSYWGLQLILSRISGSLEHHQALILCCKGHIWGQARQVHDHFFSAL